MSWPDGGQLGVLTKKRMIHVSMTVRLAGRMENHDIESRADEVFESDRCSRNFGGVYSMAFVKCWQVR